MKKWINEFLFLFLKLFGSGFSNRRFSPKTLLQAVFFQKILRINQHVPWPVHRTSVVVAPHKIERGTRCPGLSMGCYLDGRNGIIFGKNVWMGPRVSVISMNHDLYDYEKYIAAEPIVIGDNCWLATGCIILPGVRLGNHVIVAAGAVVTQSFEEDNIVLGGVPAKIIKRIGPYSGSEGRHEENF
ncbi:MAG: acyltransferase [Chloroflexi bacterium]|nr:acyltransferase [Chloroflexota bacterium]